MKHDEVRWLPTMLLTCSNLFLPLPQTLKPIRPSVFLANDADAKVRYALSPSLANHFAPVALLFGRSAAW
jgi:hypothetical protein